MFQEQYTYQTDKLTLVVCETENPNLSGNSSMSLFMRVDFPEPEGPHKTKGRWDMAFDT